MNFDEANNAIRDAERTIDNANHLVRNLAWIMKGRLRSGCVPASVLIEMKRELADFNIQTRRWKRK